MPSTDIPQHRMPVGNSVAARDQTEAADTMVEPANHWATEPHGGRNT